MTSSRFVLRMAGREVRASRRLLLLLTASVMAGVAALVAVNSFTHNLQISVAEQAQALLGADLSIVGRQQVSKTPAVQTIVDSIAATDGDMRMALSASMPAMAYSVNGGARLVQLRSVDPSWPFYGTVETAPAGIWPDLQQGGVIVDPSLLTMINAQIGDSIGVGNSKWKILGTVVNVPGDVGLQMAFGARVFLATRLLPQTGLLEFGARASWETFFKLSPTADPQLVATRLRDVALAERMRVRTVADDRERRIDNLTRLGNYLGLVALASLLLGGLGVASAVHVFIRRKLETIAVLRCLGATASQVFLIYLIQAVGMGLLGSALGALVGIGLQQAMPLVLADFIPRGVRVVPSFSAVMIGVGLGLWTAVVFAILPLLGIRDIPPLVSLRNDASSKLSKWQPLRIGAAILLALSVIALAALQVKSLTQGAAFAAAIGGALLILRVASWLLIHGVRRWTSAKWPYLWRQGLANLHRPANQTVTVLMSLGFGAFILSTIFLAQYNLLGDLRLDRSGGERPNLVLFDIQNDQRMLVDSALKQLQLKSELFTPIVPMRMLEVAGKSVKEILSRVDTTSDTVANGREGGAMWAFRREYRSTYRAALGRGEKLSAGKWFDPNDRNDGRTADMPVAISMERELAGELKVGLGDLITWDVQGISVYSKITSLREVNWAMFEPNFFVEFAPGALESAPQSWATLTRSEDPAIRGGLQRSLAERAANVTTVDLGEMARALESVVDRIILAVRFMAFFSLATGTVVLIGAIATSRWQRIREGTLLRTLGATRRQVLSILSIEYAALGISAALVAATLAAAAGWALARFRFEVAFVVPWGPLTLLAVGLVCLTTIIGLLNSLEVLKRPPLEVLRNN